MTIQLPETSSTNTEMGVSFDTCLHMSIEIHVFRLKCVLCLKCTILLFWMFHVFGSLGCTIRREYHALQGPMMTAIKNCVTDFARFSN